jgi:uncharacterized protein (DUF111 family)
VEGELTTPTGAAIASTLAEQFGPLPAMTVESIGYGAGTRQYEHHANVLRVIVGSGTPAGSGERVWVLETNLDDMTGELIGHCTSLLGEAGALDVYTVPIQMKKNRPGVILSVICREPDVEALEEILLRETTTLGIRRWPVARRTLNRRPHSVPTAWGPVEGKLAWSAGVPVRFSPEYESCRVIAGEHGVPLTDVYQAAREAFDSSSLELEDSGE